MISGFNLDNGIRRASEESLERVGCGDRLLRESRAGLGR